MALKRIMPCLLLQDKRLVKTVNFENDIHGGNDANSQINLKIAREFNNRK